MYKYNANIKCNFYWIIPFLIGFSKNHINENSVNYSVFITPFIEISFSQLGTRHGYNIDISDNSESTEIDNKENVKKILQKKFDYTDDILAEEIDNLYNKS